MYALAFPISLVTYITATNNYTNSSDEFSIPNTSGDVKC